MVKSDTLLDSLLVLARQKPLHVFKTFRWVMDGKAAFKSQVGNCVSLDVVHLPYNQPLLAFLEQEKRRGRRIYLATGADACLAERIAEHLGIFDGVLASDGSTNLIGGNKLESLKAQFAEGFDYIGNAKPDLPLLEHSGTPMMANAHSSLRSGVRSRKIIIGQHFVDRAPLHKVFFKTIRLHQWAKNVLIFLPLLLAHSLKLSLIMDAIIAFFCFSLCASATYIINDLLDIEADRRHPKKKFRPFASGNLSPVTGVAIIAVFMTASFLLTVRLLPLAFLGWLLVYLVTTLIYSLYLKRVVLIDVLILSGLYTVRMLAGGAATDTFISGWLGGFSVFLFFSLAVVKRFSELHNIREQGATLSKANGRGYLLTDIEQLRSFGTASGYAAIVVFSLYISGSEVSSLYSHPVRLWLVVPLMLLWISRVWLLASRGEMNEDPVIFAVTDRMSLLMAATVALVVISAAL